MRHISTLLLYSILWISCASPQGSEPVQSPAPLLSAKRVEVLNLSPTTFNDLIELTGIVEARHDVIVSSKTTGTLEQIVDLGTTVRSGQIVANTDDDLLRANLLQVEAQVSNAEAGLKIAEESYNRQRPLFSDSIISELEYIGLETTLSQAKSNVAQAKAIYKQVALQLNYTSITAPIYGTVEARYVEVGEQVVPGTQILRLVDTRDVFISAGISERFAGDIEVGTPAQIQFPSAGISPREGRVIFAGRVIDPESRSFEINVAFENNDGTMKPEMIADLAILRTTIENALVIPRNAVTRTETGHSVFIASEMEDGYTALVKDIQLGAEYANKVVIIEGLSLGDQVVVRGQSTLANQDLVIIDQTYTQLDEFGVPVMDSSSSIMLDQPGDN